MIFSKQEILSTSPKVFELRKEPEHLQSLLLVPFFLSLAGALAGGSCVGSGNVLLSAAVGPAVEDHAGSRQEDRQDPFFWSRRDLVRFLLVQHVQSTHLRGMDPCLRAESSSLARFGSFFCFFLFLGVRTVADAGLGAKACAPAR